jgi:hypothetical protein
MTRHSRLPLLSLLLLCLALLWTFLARPAFLPELNSDSLYLDDLWASFFDGRGFKAWYLPPAPSFFPDLALTWISQAAGPDLGLRHLLYALLSAALLGGGGALCCRRLLGLGALESCLCAFSGLGFYVAFMAPNSTLSQIFVPGHHGGAMIASLGMLAFAPRRGKAPGFLALALWALAAGLMALSDRLILAWALVPLFFYLGGERAPRLAWLAAVLTGWVLASALLFYWRRSGPHVGGFGLEFYRSNAGPLLREGLGSFATLLRREALLGLLAAAWFGFLAWKTQAGLARFCCLSGLASLGIVTFAGGVSGRYFYPIFFAAAVFSPSFAALRWKGSAAFMALAAVFFLGLRALNAGPPGLALHRETPPPGLAALQAQLERSPPSCGYADYWRSRQLRMLSHGKVWTEPVISYPGLGRVGPNRWIANPLAPPYPRNYVVMNGLDRAAVQSSFGKPKKKKYFEGLEVWFYGAGIAPKEAGE